MRTASALNSALKARRSRRPAADVFLLTRDEGFVRDPLSGYRGYAQHVRNRLTPALWLTNDLGNCAGSAAPSYLIRSQLGQGVRLTTWDKQMPPLSAWKPDDLLKAIALVGAALAFIIGLAQYRRAQHWKRAEWVVQEMKGLFGDPVVQAVFLMIDWGSRRVALHPGREQESDRYVLLTNEIVADALMLHSDRPDGFSPLEADIRAAFDRALDGLERFHAYANTGLVELSDLRPYLKYWAVSLCSPRPARAKEHRMTRLTAYMSMYGYEGALELLQQLAAAERAFAADAADAAAPRSSANAAPDGPLRR